ncbi:HD-GYP domain-containing protein [Lichenifustis flavocetrariae]|uniref:HD domain-containing protein n=1 Tax=Lichenifustis flavocetrariae TaxID=2949735 RepID=A0AA41Z6H2_9HYPH|nr:HD domain-containing phosphohydrolase [Lichenifustis flavocetrariae]MCW6511230.1 HD domain-containing protein [Lichenifustis flavocetrariae]
MPSLIVCDVAFDNVASIEALHAALAYYRSGRPAPVLCLVRDPSQLTQAQAQAAGASAIVPVQTPPSQLITTIHRLLAGLQNENASDDGTRLIEAGVRDTEAALAGMLESARQRQDISVEALDRGGDVVLSAMKRTNVRAWLDVVWKYDDITYQHCLLVAGLVAAFSVALGLSPKTQRLLSQAALLHDVGKAHIPYAILNKAGRLTPEEFTIMRNHPMIGYNLLAGQRQLDPCLLDVVRHHHEYIDGSGYPDGLQGKRIPDFVRLVTICDIYAALIERRSYKPPTTSHAALSHLVEMGVKLDTGLVQAFHKVVGAT